MVGKPKLKRNAARCGTSETLTSTSGGDQITFTVDDEACPTTTPNLFHQHGTYVVTGGTNRFAGANGTGTFDCYGEFGHLAYSFTLSGTISPPAKT